MFRMLAACLFAAVALVLGCSGSRSAPPTRIGAPIHLDRSVAIDALADDPREFAGQRVLIEGTVSEVCQGSGCWALVAGPGGKSVYARSADETVLLPTNCQGAAIRVEGELIVDEAALEAELAAGTAGTWEGDHYCPNPAVYVTLSSVELRGP